MAIARTGERRSFQQGRIKDQKIKLFLEAYPEILFAEFAEAFQLQEINPTFDTGKQPKGMGYKLLARLAHL